MHYFRAKTMQNLHSNEDVAEACIHLVGYRLPNIPYCFINSNIMGFSLLKRAFKIRFNDVPFLSEYFFTVKTKPLK
jgi:hypothetical protein